MKKTLLSCIVFVLLGASMAAQQKTTAETFPKAQKSFVLKADNFKHYADYFNRMEDENIVQAISNAQAWDWMKSNIPLFECPQDNFQEMFYYRWWSIRKHIKVTPVGYAFTEFLVNRSYADKYNLISCAFGHHIAEARWLADPKYLDQYVHVWYRGKEGKPMNKLRGFSSWTAAALYNRYMVDGNAKFALDMLPDLEAEYAAWEGDHRSPNGMFWQSDVKDGMEETISGGRREKNNRPTINSYMYGNAKAISELNKLAGNTAKAKLFAAKADTLKKLIESRLWNDKHDFFETLKEKGDTLAQAREQIGFIPWFFNLPTADKGYEKAWEQVKDEKGFLSPYGLTTAERRHPSFRTRGVGKCEWDGAVWPFATAQTLTAMANLLNSYNQNTVTNADYFRHLELYVETQYHRGRPYIGEYHDEVTGYWLKGDQERSRYYNHSTFNDLIITGLVGLRPRTDNKIEVNPLAPEGKWDWFCLDRVPYHGKVVTIIWDKDGSKYKKGKGLQVLVNGKKVASSDKLERIEGNL